MSAIRAIGGIRDVNIETPQELEQQGLLDVNWIEDFSARGGRAFVSGDGNMRRVQLERAALEASGLIAIFPHMNWYGKLGRWGQAAYFLVWFPTIVRIANEAERGTHYRLPTSFSGEYSSIELLPTLAEVEARREEKAQANSARREELELLRNQEDQ